MNPLLYTLLWSAIAMLTINVIILLIFLIRSRCRIIYILTAIPKNLPEKRVITPDELRETAWKSWSSLHPAADQIEQQQTQWIIEKKVRDLERRNRQPNPFADTQKPRRG